MEYYQAQYYNEALMHYGVKGMKWGVRRRQRQTARRVKKLDKRLVKLQKKQQKEEIRRTKKASSQKINQLQTRQTELENALKTMNERRKRNGYETGRESQEFTRTALKLQATKSKLKKAQGEGRNKFDDAVKYTTLKKDHIKVGDSPKMAGLKAKRTVTADKLTTGYVNGLKYSSGTPRDIFASEVARMKLKRAERKQAEKEAVKAAKKKAKQVRKQNRRRKK